MSLVCHYFVTLELAEDPGRLEVLHLALFWLASLLPVGLFSIRATGGVDPLVVMWALFWTYPAYAILNKLRKAIRAHQLRQKNLGGGVEDFFVQGIALSLLSTLFLESSEFYKISSLNHVGQALPSLSSFSGMGKKPKIAVD